MTTLRRSGRSRKPVESIYDSAEKATRESKNGSKKKSKQQRPIDEDNENNSENASLISREDEDPEEMDQDSSSEEEESDEEEVLKPTRKRKAPKAPAAKKVKDVSASGGESKTKRRTSLSKGTGAAPNKRQAGSALTALAKKAMDPQETCENSLAKALLFSFRDDTTKRKNGSTDTESFYTIGLQKIARGLLADHKSNANAVETKLLNLVLRSVGGKSLLSEDEDLDDMADDEWSSKIEDIVTEMEDTEAEKVLLPTGKASAGAAEYRKVYAEFWYQLASTALNSSDDDKFAVEWVRDILARLIEMMDVGVPEIRMAIAVAVYRFGLAMLERTADLSSKLRTADRQLSVARKSKSTRKAEGLEQQIDSWKRCVADLEDMVKETVMAMFMKRFKDTSEHIRECSLLALTDYCRCRPDMFVSSFYLKYFGWMLSDLEAIVRTAAIQGLLTPFQAKVDTSNMKNVIVKFTGRLADCILDVNHKVQEVAMELLLILMREDYFDDVENMRIWTQINNRAIAEDTTPSVRRNALYFVLDQLTPFDVGPPETERQAIDQLRSIANWMAHTLSEGDIPLENMRYDLTDLLVFSLRSMPEYKQLVCNWPAMLKALNSDDRRKSSSKSDQRNDVVKQRILLQMLVTAAQMEVADVVADNSDWMDPTLVECWKQEHESLQPPGKKTKMTKKQSSSSHEELTMALLRALPELLVSFKSETPILQSLLTLPQYFLPNVLNLTSRKKEFQTLMSNLTGIFLESTDVDTLTNCCRAMVSLASGNHSRSDEALLGLKRIAGKLRSRLLELLEEKSIQLENAENDDDDEDMTQRDLESSISFCLRRLHILSKRWSTSELLEDKGSDDAELDAISGTVADYLTKELTSRQLIYHRPITQGDADRVEIPKIWDALDGDIHDAVAESVSEGMGFLLCMTAWRLEEEIERIDDKDALAEEKENAGEAVDEDDVDEELQGHLAIRNRDRLKNLISLCYEQYIEIGGQIQYSEAQEHFSTVVQEKALRIAGDLRSLFPRQWKFALSPFLRACAFVEDGVVVGAGVRFARAQQFRIREAEEGSKEKQEAVSSLLFPLVRGLAPNWATGSRKEAGVVLAHIVGSGKDTHDSVMSVSRILKKQQPVRLLEAHMACLRQDFESWTLAEPEEPGDRPTDSEMADFEEAEKLHAEQFEAINSQASRLSASLGVGKIKEKLLASALLGFVREGVRFAFSTDDDDSDEPFPLGGRLMFLTVLSKYLPWIRRQKEQKEILCTHLNQLETDLRNNSEFSEVYELDKDAIAQFRKIGDLGEFFVEDNDTLVTGAASQFESMHGGSTVRSKGPRLSIGSSVSSIQSKRSQESLKSIEEEDEEDFEQEEEDEEQDNGGDDTPTHAHRSRTAASSSVAKSVDSVSTMGQHSTDGDDSGEEGSDAEHDEGDSDKEDATHGDASTPSPSQRGQAAVSVAKSVDSVSTMGQPTNQGDGDDSVC